MEISSPEGSNRCFQWHALLWQVLVSCSSTNRLKAWRRRCATDETGVGSILVEQHVDVVLDFASRVFVLERGVVVFTGSTEELKERPDVLNRAIGLEKAAPGG
jgi:ABC-type branched-subunit amino acid transport system ATPase component